MKIYLGDLGHYTVKLTNNHTPINIGFIAAYAKKHLGDAIKISLFKNPDKIFDAIEQDPPDLLGLSNYVWCQSISEDVFKYYKKVHKDGIALWGGPNFPMNEIPKAKKYLLERSYIDFYVPFEGETPTLNIVKAVIDTSKNLPTLKDGSPELFDGAFFINSKRELVGNKIGVQIPELNNIPSPYLEGWMDDFLQEGLHAMFETQRGCPYHCTFCHTGLRYYDRGRSFPLDRLKQEIEYIIATVKDPTKTHLYITDSNFGMWPQDLEFTKWLRGVYEKTGFPLSFGTSTGKGRIDLVLKTVLNHPKLMLTNSVQSMDDTVLGEIKRRNIPVEQLIHSQADMDVEGKLSQPECILGLPLETRESHLNTVRKLIKDIGANIIYQYTLMLLPGTEIYTDESREKYKYVVKYRLLPTSYGEYLKKRCFEIEEVSVATKDLSFEEYLEMREVFFLVHNVHSNVIYRSLMRYLIYLNDDVISFFLFMIERRKALSDYEFANQAIEAYLKDTREELFNSREELVRYFSDEQNWKDLTNGLKGKNLTHSYRTIVLLNSRAWADFVTQSFKEFLMTRHGQDSEIMKIAESIIKHVTIQAECQVRYFSQRESIPSQVDPLRAELDFDVPGIFGVRVDRDSYPVFPENHGIYLYYMRDDAIHYITSFKDEQRTVDLALIVLRMDQSYLFPVCSRLAEELVST